MKNSLKLEAFETYFLAQYGDRWAALRKALLEDAPKTALVNPFGENYSDYSLDPASLYPVKYLDARENQSIADFCASPGGKSLAMVFALEGKAKWFCNDLSPARVSRLRAVVHDSVPSSVLANIHVTKSDASQWGLRRKEHFDRILVDAPCSGERHLMQTPKELSRWSLKGAKRLVIRQNALLCSALDCLKPGGRMVYSTCSINRMENDGVIERLMKSREGKFRLLPVVGAEMGEATGHGWIILPDRAAGGPTYFSIIEKI